LKRKGNISMASVAVTTTTTPPLRSEHQVKVTTWTGKLVATVSVPHAVLETVVGRGLSPQEVAILFVLNCGAPRGMSLRPKARMKEVLGLFSAKMCHAVLHQQNPESQLTVPQVSKRFKVLQDVNANARSNNHVKMVPGSLLFTPRL